MVVTFFIPLTKHLTRSNEFVLSQGWRVEWSWCGGHGAALRQEITELHAHIAVDQEIEEVEGWHATGFFFSFFLSGLEL